MIAVAILLIICLGAAAQDRGNEARRRDRQGAARPVTIPLTIIVRESKPQKEIQVVDFTVREDGEMQETISIRRPGETPLTLALLIQDDLVASVGTETKGMAGFLRRLPVGSRVMVGYLRTGSLEVRRKFTGDLERVAEAVRPPRGLASGGPYNPYVEIIEAARRFDSQPTGRRAVILVSDGLDVSRGIDSSAPSESLDLQRAITEAQRRGIAVYSLYAPSAALAASGNELLVGYAQSSLERLSSETGGRAYFQGTGAPLSFDRFLSEIEASLAKQLALTYLSTHTNKGFHRIDVKPLVRDIEIRHPAGYTR